MNGYETLFIRIGWKITNVKRTLRANIEWDNSPSEINVVYWAERRASDEVKKQLSIIAI